MRLYDNVVHHVLMFLQHGVWHGVCRLVCRRWSDILSPPSPSPYEWAIRTRNDGLIYWMRRDAHIPWTHGCLLQPLREGHIDDVLWFAVQGAPDLWMALDEPQREILKHAIVQGGVGLCDAAALPGLKWTVDIVPVFLQHQGGAEGDSFAQMWHTLCDLCHDPHPYTEASVVLAACQYSSMGNLHRVLSTDWSLHLTTRLWCMILLCSVERVTDGLELFSFLAEHGPPGWPLPNLVLQAACGVGFVALIKAFLFHPRCNQPSPFPGYGCVQSKHHRW